MDIDKLKQANELSSKIENTKKNIGFLKQLLISRRQHRITDGEYGYCLDSKIAEKVLNQLLSDEENKLSQLEFQFNAL